MHGYQLLVQAVGLLAFLAFTFAFAFAFALPSPSPSPSPSPAVSTVLSIPVEEPHNRKVRVEVQQSPGSALCVGTFPPVAAGCLVRELNVASRALIQSSARQAFPVGLGAQVFEQSLHT